MSLKKNKNNLNKENNKNVSVTDEKMINEILGNIGKKTKNPEKKNLINNFVKKNNKEISEENKENKENKKTKEENNENKKTFTDKLTKDEINEKLEDYKLVEDLSKVPLDTHLRYFLNKDGKMLFRMGGNLKRNFDLPNFIVLKNALGTEWTVQVKNTTFYKKMSLKEIKEEYEVIISELHEKIKKLKSKIKELEK